MDRRSTIYCLFSLALILPAFSLAIPLTEMGELAYINGSDEVDVNELLDSMTLMEKVGQMMMPFFYGSVITPEIEELISDWHIGGVILFTWSKNLESPEQTARLTNQLQEAAMRDKGIPLLVSIDQEGGRVKRIVGGTDFPGNMALGATRSKEHAYSAGRIMGSEIKAIGANINFAPVLDVNSNPLNPVIGDRSFGEDPDMVSELGTAYIKGLRDEGVIATGKHFPGHGDTSVDSHTGLPVVAYDAETLKEVHLKPFQAAIDGGLDAIMTAHIIVNAIDPEYPATLSGPVLTGLLREGMGFNGVIISDAMMMAAISEFFGPMENAVIKTINAGSDIVLMPQSKDWTSSVKNVISTVVEAVKNGKIAEERINESVSRILDLKVKYGLFNRSPADLESVQLSTPEHKSVELEIARDSITFIKDDAGLLPLQIDPAQRILLVSPIGAHRFSSAIANHHPNVGAISVSGNPTESEIAGVLTETAEADIIILCTSRAQLSEYSNQVNLVNDLIGVAKPLIVIALRTPYDITKFPQIGTYLTGYGYRDCTFNALSEVLFGVIEPEGLLPVTIPELYPYGHGLP